MIPAPYAMTSTFPGQLAAPSVPVPHGRLFLGNLATEKTSLKEIEGIFLRHGPLRDVHLPQGKSYGFVQYENPLDAERALATENGLMLHGLRLDLKPAMGRPEDSIRDMREKPYQSARDERDKRDWRDRDRERERDRDRDRDRYSSRDRDRDRDWRDRDRDRDRDRFTFGRDRRPRDPSPPGNRARLNLAATSPLLNAPMPYQIPVTLPGNPIAGVAPEAISVQVICLDRTVAPYAEQVDALVRQVTTLRTVSSSLPADSFADALLLLLQQRIPVVVALRPHHISSAAADLYVFNSAMGRYAERVDVPLMETVRTLQTLQNPQQPQPSSNTLPPLGLTPQPNFQSSNSEGLVSQLHANSVATQMAPFPQFPQQSAQQPSSNPGLVGGDMQLVLARLAQQQQPQLQSQQQQQQPHQQQPHHLQQPQQHQINPQHPQQPHMPVLPQRQPQPTTSPQVGPQSNFNGSSSSEAINAPGGDSLLILQRLLGNVQQQQQQQNQQQAQHHRHHQQQNPQHHSAAPSTSHHSNLLSLQAPAPFFPSMPQQTSQPLSAQQPQQPQQSQQSQQSQQQPNNLAAILSFLQSRAQNASASAGANLPPPQQQPPLQPPQHMTGVNSSSAGALDVLQLMQQMRSQQQHQQPHQQQQPQQQQQQQPALSLQQYGYVRR